MRSSIKDRVDLAKLEQVITWENISKSIEWFEANRQTIARVLPLEYEGVTFTRRWLRLFDPHEHKLNLRLATVYVHAPMTLLFKALKAGGHPIVIPGQAKQHTTKVVQPTKITRAFTVYRPWSYAFVFLGKRIENRTYKPPMKPDEWVAIHAGRQWEESGVQWIEANKLGVVPRGVDHPRGVVAIARYRGTVTESSDPWFVGPVGWLLDNVRPLREPVLCNGRQRVWNLGDQLATEVINRVAA